MTTSIIITLTAIAFTTGYSLCAMINRVPFWPQILIPSAVWLIAMAINPFV